ncbi:helix-turn-helix transcriptional regulator [Actinoplanes sp. L3-i22]|uniref:helix-turn-helix domain-containing protein n=1 Tax=Actinoplanes sp. L3-i22 TaxID=2836373 RepID=UPI001C78E275|nr:helix-turn-helix transcriptional regulator [Actinoplanes sp. L3-i22]BCY07678.1 transcriptional regulator [Actinoplanes sp. L3-i22]
MSAGERRESALKRKRLVRRLNEIRRQTSYTQADVAKEMHWSQSKVHRIETGENSISFNDLNALMGLYGLADSDVFEELAKMAEVARRRSLPQISDIHSKDFRAFLESEITADTEREFENVFVPGLLQTSEYAGAVMRTLLEIDSATGDEKAARTDRARRIIEVREWRQQVFAEGGMTLASFVLDEAVIRRVVGAESGDTSVMRGQLEHLKTMSRHERVDLRVLPFAAGAHVALSGPFVMLGFKDPEDLPQLYLENAAGESLTTQDEAHLTRFTANFEAIQARSVRGDELDALLDHAIDAIR